MNQRANHSTARHLRPKSGHGGSQLGTLWRGGDVCECLSIDSRRGRVNDERHPTRPGRPRVLPPVIRAPLDDGVARVFEVRLGTIWENQDDFSGH